MQLESIFKKSSRADDQVDLEDTAMMEPWAPIEDTSRQCIGNVTKDTGQPIVDGHPIGLGRDTVDTYSYASATRGNSQCRKWGI